MYRTGWWALVQFVRKAVKSLARAHPVVLDCSAGHYAGPNDVDPRYEGLRLFAGAHSPLGGAHDHCAYAPARGRNVPS